MTHTPVQSPPHKKRKLNNSHTSKSGKSSTRSQADTLYASDPYNVESWMHLLKRTNKEAILDDQRHILTLFLTVFPSSARQWKHYIELEISHNNLPLATELFKKCISNKCYDVELYHAYIALAAKINASSSADFKLKNLNEAYKFALKQVGQDLRAASLWRQYLTFLKSHSDKLSAKHGIADSTLEIRKVYQSAIKLPLDDCDKLWDEYLAWEGSLNAQLAMAFKDKLWTVHERAKQVQMERKRRRRGLLMHVHSVPSTAQHAQERNYQQIQLWRRAIDFELENQEELGKTDLWRRMEFTFRQALMCLALFPDIWLMYIEWTQRNRGVERTQSVYKQCLQRLPDCLLIHFKYLEFLEIHKS